MSSGSQTSQLNVRSGAYPELTYQAILVGYLLGALLAFSIGYAALILGFSIEGSELAAILGFGILRGVLRRRSIVENNVVQTIASAVNGASSGLMFTVPAIFIMGYGQQFDPMLLTFGSIAGAFLGIAFIIPLRRQMIDYERLTYPGGVAVATILKSPGAGMEKAQLLIGAALLAAAIHFFVQYTDMTHGATGEYLNYGLFAKFGLPEYLNGTWQVSLLTIGVAFIAGRGGIAFIIGGFVCYWFLAPLLIGTGSMMLDPATGEMMTNPGPLRTMLYRPVGIGMLIGGALMGVVLSFPLIISTIRSMQQSSKIDTVMSKDEMPIKLLYMAIFGSVLVLSIMAVNSADNISITRGILMAVFGTIWIWMAGIILSEAIGRTNWSPLSGMTLIGVTILILTTSGLDKPTAIIAAIMVGAATAVAMSQATDLMLDLKTGYLVGATPRKQQLGQFIGAWLGPILVVSLIFILHDAYGLGSDRLPAPQATALASTLDGLLGGDAPIWKYLAGAGMGALLSAASGGLGITVGLGFYLPFNIVLTYAIGTAIREFVDRKYGKTWSHEKGIPVAAGFIVGEALVGVGFAMYIVFG